MMKVEIIDYFSQLILDDIDFVRCISNDIGQFEIFPYHEDYTRTVTKAFIFKKSLIKNKLDNCVVIYNNSFNIVKFIIL